MSDRRHFACKGPLAALAMGLLLVLALPRPVMAEAPGHEFSQPAQPLLQAVTEIARVAGVSVVIKGSGAGLSGPALAGRMTLDQALATVLAGSGATWHRSSGGRIIVTLPIPQSAPEKTAAEPEMSLGTIVLTATGQPQLLTDAPATMTVISGDDIATRPTGTLADLLRDVPGLAVTGPLRDGVPLVTLRGMGPSCLLFMIDGRPLSASEEASYNGHGINSKIGFLPPVPVIDRIEIIRGPMSSLYGSAASGGVINVITRSIPDQWGGSAALGYTHDTSPDAGASTEARLMLGGPLIEDRLGLMLYAARNRRGEDGPGFGGQGQGGTDRTGLGLRLRYSPDARQSFDFDLRQSRLDFHRSAIGTGRARDTLVVNRALSLSHHMDWGGGAVTDSFLQGEATDFRSGTASGHDAITFNTHTALTAGRHRLSFGYEYRFERTRHDPGRLLGSADTSPDRWHHAWFAEGEFRLREDMVLTLGLRRDRNENYGTAFTPRAWLVWHLSPELTLKGGIGTGYRVPALKQGDSNVSEPSGGNGRSRDRGNSALRPERSTNLELGLVWEPQSGLQLGATLFHTGFHDRITRRDLCRTPSDLPPGCMLEGAVYEAVTQYVNEDRADITGVELTLDMPLGPLDLSANYTWSASEVTRGSNRGQPFHRLPRHMLNLGARMEAGDTLTLRADLRLRSHSLSTGRSSRVPGHMILDLGLDCRLGDETVLTAGIYNVTDRRLDESVPNGRSFYLGLSRSF
ncbi:TonB-dependent receptor [Pseudogemmobacter bohemicus]|uniref:TonB-dependent receptor n=1 Tax=Pseudogemmobacter bohemicus TaxID=2250708 RepID=UPI000DD33713|nr:TonB-dependent receptor [Pseudogemmobacter bohemicus]